MNISYSLAANAADLNALDLDQDQQIFLIQGGQDLSNDRGTQVDMAASASIQQLKAAGWSYSKENINFHPFSFSAELGPSYTASFSTWQIYKDNSSDYVSSVRVWIDYNGERLVDCPIFGGTVFPDAKAWALGQATAGKDSNVRFYRIGWLYSFRYEFGQLVGTITKGEAAQ